MNLFALPPRVLFLALFAVCTGLLGFGLYLQHYGGYEPCPMCIMQRYAFLGVALVALVGAIHGPRGGGGAKVYAGVILLLTLAGGGVAARQTWMQLYPPQFTECGPDLEFMLDSFPLADALPMIFRGAGDCAAIDWTFLGLSIANWSLVMFSVVGLLAIAFIARRR